MVAGLTAAVVAFGAVTLLALEGREVVVLRTRAADGTARDTRTWVADEDGAMWIECANPERPFLADVRSSPAVELRRGGRWRPCEATVASEPDGHRRIRRLLAAKYGWADTWIGLLADTSRSLAIRLSCR